MTKPSSKLLWCVGNADFANNVIEPVASKKQAGWALDESPPYEFANWQLNIIHQWLEYLESKADTSQLGYDAVIGDTNTDAAATHDTLQDAVNDVALGTNLRVYVKDDATLNAPVNLTKAGWRVHFAPGVVYTKGSANSALSVEADGIVVEFGRFAGFTGGSDSAIKFTAAGTYGQVLGARFAAGTNEEVDISALPAGTSPRVQTITEQP